MCDNVAKLVVPARFQECLCLIGCTCTKPIVVRRLSIGLQFISFVTISLTLSIVGIFLIAKLFDATMSRLHKYLVRTCRCLPNAYLSNWRGLCQSRIHLLLASRNPYMILLNLPTTSPPPGALASSGSSMSPVLSSTQRTRVGLIPLATALCLGTLSYSLAHSLHLISSTLPVQLGTILVVKTFPQMTS